MSKIIPIFVFQTLVVNGEIYNRLGTISEEKGNNSQQVRRLNSVLPVTSSAVPLKYKLCIDRFVSL